MVSIAKSPMELDSCSRCGFHRSVHDGQTYTIEKPKKLCNGIIVIPCTEFVEKILQREDEVLGEHLSTDHDTLFVCERDSVTVYSRGRRIGVFRRV